VDEVILGNIIQTDPRGNPAREAVLKAGFDIKTTAYTVNKNCGSALKAVSLADMMLKMGGADIIIAGGMESMSNAPYVLRKARVGYRIGNTICSDLLTDMLEGMGMTAERVAERYNITRYEQDVFSVQSQKRAWKAQSSGKFNEEIVPIKVKTKNGERVFDKDEGIKPDSTVEVLSRLKPVFKPGGTVTAGNSSTINDGAAAVLMMSSQKVKEMEIKPMARVISWASAGVEPEIMGIGPIPAAKKALKTAGLTLSDIDLIELNEAFAAQALACIQELGLDMEKVNVNGGAIALGHPVGATGAVILVKLIYELKRQNKKYGLATMCVGGGQGIAVIIENIP
jgi:acetyl-CoA C-acetyltransferase